MNIISKEVWIYVQHSVESVSNFSFINNYVSKRYQTFDNKKTMKLMRDRELPMTKNVKCEIFDEH